jgi:hypothetical protein
VDFVLSHPCARKKAQGWGTERFTFFDALAPQTIAQSGNPIDLQTAQKQPIMPMNNLNHAIHQNMSGVSL